MFTRVFEESVEGHAGDVEGGERGAEQSEGKKSRGSTVFAA